MTEVLNELGNEREDTGVAVDPASIRDVIKSAFAEADSAVTPAASTDAAAAKARDEAGRFAKPAEGQQTPAVAAKPAAAAPAVSTPAVAAVVDPNAAAVAAPATKAPSSWAAEAKDKFAALPPEVQAAVSKREQEIERGFSVLSDYKGLEQFSPMIKQAGTTHADVMRKAIDWERSLETDPLNTIASVAKIVQRTTGLALENILNPALIAHLGKQQPQQQRPAPQQQPINVKSEVQLVLREQEIENQISAFYSDPANVHVEAVSDAMAALISTGQAKTIKEAYETACWMRPDIRQQLISQAAPQAVNPQIAQRAAAADQARKASRSVTGSSAPGPSQGVKAGAPSSIRDTLKDAMASSNGRV